MRLSARTSANRRNARRSTGPKSAAGKAVVARNALRHGLAIPVAFDPTLAPEIEHLALAIAGDDRDSVRLDRARRIAEAQIDLIRIRTARLDLLGNPRERVKPMRVTVLKRAISAAKIRQGVDEPTYRRRLKTSSKDSRARFDLDLDVEDAFEEMENLIETGRPSMAELPTLLEGLDVLAPKLARLDRYERRALSRRKRAIREYDALAQTFPRQQDA